MNPVTEVDDSVKRGLVTVTMHVEQLLGSNNFKQILQTDATTVEGEYKVTEYFGVHNKWQSLLEQWEKVNQNVTAFKQY